MQFSAQEWATPISFGAQRLGYMMIYDDVYIYIYIYIYLYIYI